ncbi:MAG: diadenylate cyclase CdaA [Sphingobacteriales bacterium JAD_PAG50586_3]|nr:MAG: diadenylate cyclase CdaA [Sphingobacteriales bacterium JAD_PAG50586_3]
MDFLTLRWIDVVDILLVALLIYEFYALIKDSAAVNVFIGIVAFYVLWLVVKALNLQLLSTILGQFIGVGVVAVIVVFQQEIRRFLLLVGNKTFFENFTFFGPFIARKTLPKLNTQAIASACSKMSKTKTGVLIVVSRKTDLKFYANTGYIIDAEVSSILMENIFYKNNPMHDGAMIITENRIKAVKCILPVSEKLNLPANLGLRHRAAIGITEHADAVAIVVSEQTGNISYFQTGNYQYHISVQELERLLKKDFS